MKKIFHEKGKTKDIDDVPLALRIGFDTHIVFPYTKESTATANVRISKKIKPQLLKIKGIEARSARAWQEIKKRIIN